MLMTLLAQPCHARIGHLHIVCHAGQDERSGAHHQFMRAAAVCGWASSIHTLSFSGHIGSTGALTSTTSSCWLTPVASSSLRLLLLPGLHYGLRLHGSHDVAAWHQHIIGTCHAVTHLDLSAIDSHPIDLQLYAQHVNLSALMLPRAEHNNLSGLRHIKQLATIDLHLATLPDEDVLAVMLAQHPALTHLCMAGQQLSADTIRAWSTAHPAHIRVLDLSSYRSLPHDLDTWLTLLCIPTLQHLNLFNIAYTPVPLSHELLTRIASTSSLHTLI